MADDLKLMEKADKLLRRGKSDEALRELQESLAERPDDDALLQSVVDLLVANNQRTVAAEWLWQRFERKARLRRVTEAQALFQRLQEIQKQPGNHYIVFANLLESARLPLDAEKAFRAAAAAFRTAGSTEQELTAWRNVFRLNPRDYSTCMEILARAEAAGEREFAAQVCSTAAELSKEDPGLLEKALRLMPNRDDIRLRYARSLLKAGQATTALAVLQPLSGEAENDPQIAAVLAETLLANNQGDAARDLIEPNLDGAGEWFDRGLRCLKVLARNGSKQAVRLGAALEFRAGSDQRRAPWLSTLDSVLSEAHEESILGFLAEAFQRTGQETKLIRALYQSFDFAFAAGNFRQAADLLERVINLDPYEPSANDRRESLRGRIEERRFQTLGNRLAPAPGVSPAERPESKVPEESAPTSLDDLILQAEIFLQYNLMDQARERAQTLARLYAGEEANNPRLAKIFEATGVKVRPVAAPRGGAAPAAARPSGPAAPARPVAAAVAEAPPAADTLGLAQIHPVIRALHREPSPKRIFFTAVNHFGRLWKADRCLAAKFNSGQPPSNVVEYCAPGMHSSDPASVARLLTLIESQIPPAGVRTLCLPRLNENPQIAQILERLGIDTLIAQPLEEGGNVSGVVVLESCGGGRAWASRDAEVLASLTDQMVLALANARLRALLRQFTISDERTGLLRVSSMLEVLVAECSRALDQNSNVAVMYLELLRSTVPQHEGMKDWMERLSQKITSYIRSNDSVAQLRPNLFVLVLPDTIAVNCAAIFQKLRSVLSDFAWPDGRPLLLAAGAAEIAPAPDLSPEDIATDVLDRAARALAVHRAEPARPIRVVQAAALAQVQP